MGSCISKKKDEDKYKSVQSDQSEKNKEIDVEFSKSPSSFNLSLSNIKVKIIDLRQCQVTFKFAHFSTYQSPMNNDLSGKHVFHPDFQTQIQISEEHMRRTFLDISISDPQEEIAAVNINFFDIATGPYHFDYDYPIKSVFIFDDIEQKTKKSVPNGKISFDLKMSQIILLQLKSNEILCKMEENLKKQAYRYSMKLVVQVIYSQTHTHTFFSEYSSTFINPAFTPEGRFQDQESPEHSDAYLEDNQVMRLSIKKQPSTSQQNINRLSSTKVLTRKKTLFFNDHQKSGVNYKQLKWDEYSAVILDIEVPINQIPAASLQLCIWSFNPVEVNVEDQSPVKKHSLLSKKKTVVASNKTHDNHNHRIPEEVGDLDDMALLCETYISLNQIFKHELDDAFEIIEGVKMYNYSCTVDKGLWNHGQQEGTVTCNLVVSLPAYLSQPIVGVRTNKCVQQASSVINEAQIQVKEISELVLYHNKITDCVFKLQQDKKHQTGPDRMNLRSVLNTNIHNLVEVLQKTHKESIQSFYYKSQAELFKAQDVMLQLAHYLITTADDLDDSTRERYYLMLQHIMQRGELALNQMGFSDKTEATIQKLMKNKLSVGLSYQKFLYHTLEMVLHKLQQKAYSENERQFIEAFCARAFFQIPEFRNRFQSCLVHKDDPLLVEWRGTEFKLDGEAEQGEYFNKDLRDLFDWESHFYTYLDKEQKGQENRKMLSVLLAEDEWQKRFGKRGLAFFMFLIEWCNHVDKNVVVKEHIPWQDIPGYRSLLRAFLIEVKLKPVLDFSDAMKKALFAILSNESILNIIIVLLFNKTQYNINASGRLYDSESVIEMLEILNEALQNISKRNKKLPTQVDQPFFIRGIRTILTECEHAFCVSKCIWVLYNNYTIFPNLVDLRKELADIIFPNLAFKFFMHWSQNVRLIFHHFLLFRIQFLHYTDRYNNISATSLIQQIAQVRRPRRINSVLQPQDENVLMVVSQKYLRFQSVIEQVRGYCREQHDAAMMEERTYAKQMRQKILLRQMEQKRSKLKSQQKMNIEEEKDEVKPLGFRIVQHELLPPEPVLSKTKSEIPASISNLKLTPDLHQQKSQPGKSSVDEIVIEQNQLRYMLKAYQEYDKLETKYVKWKDQLVLKNTLKQAQENQMQQLEMREVPFVFLQIPHDEREASISNQDDW